MSEEKNEIQKLLDYYNQKDVAFVEIVLSSGEKYVAIMRDLYYFRYAKFYVEFSRPKNTWNSNNNTELEISENASNPFKFLLPGMDFSLKDTFEEIRTRNNNNSKLTDEYIFKKVYEYVKNKKLEPLFEKVVAPKYSFIGDFIIFDYIYTDLHLNPTERYLSLSVRDEFKDVSINSKEIVSIKPIFQDMKDIEITNENILKYLKEEESLCAQQKSTQKN